MSYRWMLRMDSPHICYLYLLAVIGFCYGAGVLPDRSLVGAIGGSVTFNRALAQPFITLQWKVNGTTIILNYIRSSDTLIPEDGYRDRINLDRSSGSLELMNLDLTDSGQYTVTILTPEAVSVEENTKLEVYDGPENAAMKVIPSDVHYETGSNLNLSCSAESSPPAQFQWALNGTLLSNKGPELRLGNIQINQSGSYSCWAHNTRTLRYQTSEPSDITVLEPISGAIITTSPNPPIIEGNSVNLTCDASGSIITREWMKDGQLLSAGGNLIISEDKRVLSINPVKRTDSGEYLCRVSNPVSTADAKHILIVKSEGFLTPGLSAGAIAGIVIGVLLVVGVAVGVAVYFMKKKGFFKKESSSGRSVDNTGKSSASRGDQEETRS
ncbi:carcinoembryonic antigen-related cell adhesion molecule 2-like [Salmo salar]|uniref:Carcinoembryonic antigen-related cell adhesion molecule 2-like n=1 Tax=Salmo salar TaxID=8030 RepID=A0ABM3EUF2_SALSA|nr:carcinoembryonic antigen-related cell adhesion molecule 2-like [Salmo salar]